MKRIILAGLLALLSISGAHAQCSGIQPAGSVCSNPAATGAPAAPTRVPVLGLAGTAIGSLGLSGNTSGVVTLRTGAAAGTYNFVLPATAGASGDFMRSGGGGTTASTWLTPGAGVATWMATPSSANLATALSDETGSGAAVFGTSPTIASPTVSGTIAGTPTASGLWTFDTGFVVNTTGTTASGVSPGFTPTKFIGTGANPGISFTTARK